MAAWGVLVLCFSVFSAVLGSNMQGGVMTFRPREKNTDGSLMVEFKYKSSFRDGCHNEFDWSCYSGNCGSNVQRTTGTVDSGTHPTAWCQSETRMVRRVTNDQPFQFRENKCCWVSNSNGYSGWSLLTFVDLGTRSDTSNPNSSPVTTIVPVLRVPRNCPSSLNLLAHDPDGDFVRCRYGQRYTGECSNCNPNSQFYLDQTSCTLSSSSTLTSGTYVFELVLEDFTSPPDDTTPEPISTTYSTPEYTSEFITTWEPSLDTTYNDIIITEDLEFITTWEPSLDTTEDLSPYTSIGPTDNPAVSGLSKIPLQFVLEVSASAPSCTYGQYRPAFLSPTPNNGEILHARAQEPFQLHLSAQATMDSIVDFKVSGPANMTKRFTTSPAPSSRSMIVKWTPSTDDVGDHVPFCFVAETNSGYQSEMRCLIVIVGPRTLLNSTLTCTGNTMTLIIPKSPTSGLFENHLRLNDPQCLVTSNSTHFIASVGFNSCGTQIVETEDKIVFKNQITSFENMGDVITRKHQLGISFNCSFPKETRLSTGFRAERAIYQFTEAGFGNFTYRFQFFQDSQFNAVRTQYPLDVLLRDIIYMEVEVTSMTPNVQLFVESCKATPHDNPNDPVFYDIIKDGCPRDDTLVNYPGTNTMYRFAMEAFAFIGNYEEVYVSCTVILCKLGDPNTRCARGCVTSSQRRKRSLGSETQQHFISQGPLRLKREASSNRAPDPNLALNMNTLVVAVVVLAVVAIVALAWHSYRKRVKSTSYEKLPTEEL